MAIITGKVQQYKGPQLKELNIGKPVNEFNRGGIVPTESEIVKSYREENERLKKDYKLLNIKFDEWLNLLDFIKTREFSSLRDENKLLMECVKFYARANLKHNNETGAWYIDVLECTTKAQECLSKVKELNV